MSVGLPSSRGHEWAEPSRAIRHASTHPTRVPLLLRNVMPDCSRENVIPGGRAVPALCNHGSPALHGQPTPETTIGPAGSSILIRYPTPRKSLFRSLNRATKKVGTWSPPALILLVIAVSHA